MSNTTTSTKVINLALQGGGSHGAFTWGVIDRLLDDERFDFDGICGTSAGAMNSVVCAYGLLQGGRAGAKKLLRDFWRRISIEQSFSILQPSLWDRMSKGWGLEFSPAYAWFDMMSFMLSPYQFNPMNVNPLLEIIREMVDFDALRRQKEIKLFVCATNVMKGRVRVFKTHELSAKAVMASACLPHVFQAVEIDGEHYWDGGYMGNPPMFPLIDHTNTQDILIVQINPIYSKKVPTNADEIRDRINELSFNSSLMLEMRRINSSQKLVNRGVNMGGRLKDLHIHHIIPGDEIAELNVTSKMNADWLFLKKLHRRGYTLADEWVKEHYDKVGKISSCDIQKDFF